MAASGLLFYNIFKTWKNFVLITCFCLLLIFIFDWTTVDLPCCANLCCTAKWLRYIHIDVLFLYPFPLWFLIGYWVQFPVLYSRTLLFIHPIYNSLHLPAPNSWSIPFLPASPFWQRHLCSPGLQVCLCFIDNFICAIFQIPNVSAIHMISVILTYFT